MLLHRYSKFIVQHSYLFLFIVSVISTILTVIPLVCHEIPSFADPTSGFETRGTALASRFIAWENLIDETRPSKRLAVNPKDIEDQIRINRTLYNKTNKARPRSGSKGKHKNKNKKRKHLNNTDYGEIVIEGTTPTSSQGHIHYGYGYNVTLENENAALVKNHTRQQWVTIKEINDPFTTPIDHNYASGKCGSPVSSYAHLVVTSSSNTSLLSYSHIQNLCHLQSQLIKLGEKEYHRLCERTMNKEDLCCPMWSVPNYIALMSGKDSCHNITQTDVDGAIQILHQCAGYFHNFTLMSSCSLDRCNVPKYCSQYDAVYNILFYLIDSDAFAPPTFSNGVVKNVMVFLPLARSSIVMPYYDKLQNTKLTFDTLEVSAIDFGLKNALFDLWIIQDTWLVALGGMFVFLGVWVYTRSALLTLLLLIAVTYSLGIAYFVYVYVFDLVFFPFMNLLVIVVVVGIGADDAFLFVKVWRMSCKNIIKEFTKDQGINTVYDLKNLSCAGNGILTQIISNTLKHSVTTIFITSLTTAVAFFASYISYIPAINCFSIFAGTTVLVNFFLMVTWLPTSVYVVNVKLCKIKFERVDKFYETCYEMWHDMSDLCNRFIITSVDQLYLWFVVVFGAFGVYSIIVVFYKPGLLLPNSRDFQLFQTSHPFEQYDMIYRDMFLFEKFSHDVGIGTKMPLRWIWGAEPIDNSNHLNPSSRGYLKLNDKFSISDPDAQVWLFNFCSKLKTQSFYQPVPGPLLPNCFIENFKIYMDRKCIDNIERIDRTPCCDKSSFPYKKEVFEFCIVKAIESLYQTPRELFLPGVAGPKFLKTTFPPKIAALVVEFESSVPYSMSYSIMADFYKEVENWTVNEMNSAPPSISKGWFISDFQFFDLQSTLASSTGIALVLSAALGFLVLIPATRNIVTSICALSAMIFSATVTIAILVFHNWKLNVLESVAISTSAGLVVDFNLHYALSYTHAMGTKSARVKHALSASAGPTAAAALTTGFAGIFLLRSNLLPYSQIGTFLALIMLISWIYATFFLCSLLFIVGQNRHNEKPSPDEPKSRSRVSSVCSGIPNIESHELENLACANVVDVVQSYSPSSASAITVVLHDELTI